MFRYKAVSDYFTFHLFTYRITFLVKSPQSVAIPLSYQTSVCLYYYRRRNQISSTPYNLKEHFTSVSNQGHTKRIFINGDASVSFLVRFFSYLPGFFVLAIPVFSVMTSSPKPSPAPCRSCPTYFRWCFSCHSLRYRPTTIPSLRHPNQQLPAFQGKDYSVIYS